MTVLFVTRSAIEPQGQGAISSCREYTHPLDDSRSYPTGITGSDTRIGPALFLLVAEQCPIRSKDKSWSVSERWITVSGRHLQES